MIKNKRRLPEYGDDYQDLEMPSLPIWSPQSIEIARAEIEFRRPQLSKEDKFKLDSIIAAQTSKEGLDKNKVWFTRDEAAGYLSVSAKTIDRCRLKKVLPYYQIEGTSSFRFKRQDLDKLMN